MKSLRFLFLSVHGAAGVREMGLPQEEAQMFATAWLVPASYALKSGLAPQTSMRQLLEEPSKQKANEVGIGMWSGQQRFCEQLELLGLDARGLPPIGGRALEAFFLPKGHFWLGAYIPTQTLGQSQDSLAKALAALFGHQPKRSRTVPFPWLPEFGRSSAWALAANHSLAEQVNFL